MKPSQQEPQAPLTVTLSLHPDPRKLWVALPNGHRSSVNLEHYTGDRLRDILVLLNRPDALDPEGPSHQVDVTGTLAGVPITRLPPRDKRISTLETPLRIKELDL